MEGGVAGRMTAAKCRGPANIGRLAVEDLGTAAWHLGVPAPEQSRLLLLASTKIRALMKGAHCSAMITIPAGAAPSHPHQHMCCSAANPHHHRQTAESGAGAASAELRMGCRELEVALKGLHGHHAGQ